MKKHIIMAVATSLTMSGCGIYTRYSRPEIATDGLYRDISASEETSSASKSWKEVFTDTCLQALIAEGLEKNTDLNVAHLQTEEAQAVLANARLSYLPSLDFSAQGETNHYNGTSKNVYNIGLSASWEVDVFGKQTNAKRGAAASLEYSRAYEQAVRTQLVATIAESYYTLLMLDAQMEILEQTLTNWDETIMTLEILVEAGLSNDIAVLRAKSNRTALNASVLAIQKSICDTENSLSALLKRISGMIVRSKLDSQIFTDEMTTGIPLLLLSNRPDVRQAEAKLAEAFYATNSARSAFYPSLTLSGTLGWTNNGSSVINPGKWLSDAIGRLCSPIFNKGTNIANLKIAKARQEEAALLFEQAVLDAGKDVNDALTEWQTADKCIELDEEQIVSLQEAVDKTLLLMHHTSVNYLEVLSAQQTLLSAQLTLIQDRNEKIQGVIHLYHALGGGKF